MIELSYFHDKFCLVPMPYIRQSTWKGLLASSEHRGEPGLRILSAMILTFGATPTTPWSFTEAAMVPETWVP